MIKENRRLLILFLSLIIIFIFGCSKKDIKTAPKLDAKAPDFTVSNIESESITLEKLKDKIVILSFWKIESPSSIRQLKTLQKIQVKYGESVTILAVNVEDETSKINKFINYNDYSFDIISDKNGSISNKYALSILPTTFLINQEGIIKEIKKYEHLTETNPTLIKLNS